MTRLAASTLVALAILSFAFTVSAQALTPADRARLEAEYNQLQKEIVEWQKVLDDTRAKKRSLEGDVSTLNAQIKKAEAEIRQRNVTISRLAGEIQEKRAYIGELEERIGAGKQSLARLLREQREIEDASLILFALSSENLSAFFADVDAIESISRDLHALFADLRSTRLETEREKEALDEKRSQEVDARYEVQAKRTEIKRDEAEKQELLTVAKEEEKTYQEVLADRERRAETIRAALFELRDAEGISFAAALEYAGFASEKTGVRAALILAILSQESDLGQNIGSCFVSNLVTGDGVGKNTGTSFEQVMKAPRDTVPFERITNAVGRTWATTPVSCPVGGKAYYVGRGFGGAMGPSQFIPSTWELFEDDLRSELGTSAPNPWDPKHAVMATALYLKGLGAAKGGYSAEYNAACRYYSGRACDTKKPTNYTYGKAVITKTEKFQEDIDFLKSI